MEIDFKKDEYLTLLEIVELAMWVLFAFKNLKEPGLEKYQKLEQKIFSYAKKMGYDHFITFDKKYHKYFWTQTYEEQTPCYEYIDEFENEVFWDELIERLVQRDLVNQEGIESLRKMSIEERFQKEEPIRQKYIDEFTANGFAQIQIQE